MNYLLRVSDHLNQHLVVITLDQQTAKQPAVDIVFEILGAEAPDELVAEGRLPEGQIDDLRALQKIIFDRDSDGLFISNAVDFIANGEPLDPEAPMVQVFVPSERDSVKYMRCDLVVLDKSNSTGTAKPGASSTSTNSSTSSSSSANSVEKKIEEFSRVMFLHQIAVGTIIDVTKDNADLVDVISNAESENLIEIDVKKAAYKLSEKGKRIHDSYIAEAQDLIKRFDIYGDVDVDASGTAHFDTNLGRDLRVAAFEIEGVDPFRARFLLGLNDGEWDKLENWSEVLQKPDWYAQIFAPIEQATSVEEIGESNLRRIIEQAKAALRRSS
ncbi:hypothetical protein BH11CYA1_BH11CYA1_01410 [soil metagenome]